MERLSDNAIEIVNELCTERLAYESEYVPIIDALMRIPKPRRPVPWPPSTENNFFDFCEKSGEVVGWI